MNLACSLAELRLEHSRCATHHSRTRSSSRVRKAFLRTEYVRLAAALARLLLQRHGARLLVTSSLRLVLRSADPEVAHRHVVEERIPRGHAAVRPVGRICAVGRGRVT